MRRDDDLAPNVAEIARAMTNLVIEQREARPDRRADRRFTAALGLYTTLTHIHGRDPCDKGKTWQDHARENAAFAWQHADIFLAAEPALDAPAPREPETSIVHHAAADEIKGVLERHGFKRREIENFYIKLRKGLLDAPAPREE